AGPGGVTLIERRAGDAGADARSGVARVAGRAEAVVIARVGVGRVCAGTRSVAHLRGALVAVRARRATADVVRCAEPGGAVREDAVAVDVAAARAGRPGIVHGQRRLV